MSLATAWIATRKGLIELTRRADGGWTLARTHFLGDPVTAVLPAATPGGRMWAALNLGHFGVKLHASDNGGDNWHELPAPLYPPQPEAPASAPDAPPITPWKLVMIWTLAAAGDVLWAGTLPGGLFRSVDGGASWTLDRRLWDEPSRTEWGGGGYDVPGIHSICPHPLRPAELLVAASSGGVWVHADESAGRGPWVSRCSGMNVTYVPPEIAGHPSVQDPHRVVRCAAAPDVLWCQHHGGIWRSTDDAASWIELQAPLSTFGFAVAAHPADPLTAWFVPAVADMKRVPVDGALVVNRTRDGGASFETLRTGLPQADAYDLVYRHGLAVDADGCGLLMGSTTGHLWASDDGGDRWTLVQANLPPIAAVAFG